MKKKSLFRALVLLLVLLTLTASVAGKTIDFSALDLYHSGGTNVEKMTCAQISGIFPTGAPSSIFAQKPQSVAPYSIGSLSDKAKTMAIEYLSNIRRLAGLTAVTQNEQYNQYAQAASLVNAANIRSGDRRVKE